jgi:hypothetical protein
MNNVHFGDYSGSSYPESKRMDAITFEVRTGLGTVKRKVTLRCGESDFTDHVEWATRVPRQHVKWQSVTYKGKRYQLHGGIHTNWFICLNGAI